MLLHRQGFAVAKAHALRFLAECVKAQQKEERVMLDMLEAADEVLKRPPEYSHGVWHAAFYLFPVCLTVASFDGSWMSLAVTTAFCLLRLALHLLLTGLGKLSKSWKKGFDRFEAWTTAFKTPVFVPSAVGLLVPMIAQLFRVEPCQLTSVYISL
eukprot:CAMPEP_0119333412 /NCGR_PEP_ID=MMETSP1333-20130426/85120_1 /TAXON_ID=418940 /ORGANISM="Scyphosphaera apsteinii, Strain RCC1455" /LENGTH=154 /DNA_ID=CAMNT_0007343475 /DNA_START=1 /DNA_END=461 /DNA_ORIENTATION=-